MRVVCLWAHANRRLLGACRRRLRHLHPTTRGLHAEMRQLSEGQPSERHSRIRSMVGLDGAEECIRFEGCLLRHPSTSQLPSLSLQSVHN